MKAGEGDLYAKWLRVVVLVGAGVKKGSVWFPRMSAALDRVMTNRFCFLSLSCLTDAVLLWMSMLCLPAQ